MIFEIFRGHGVTGRHAALRMLWRKPWGFDSPWPHHNIILVELVDTQTPDAVAQALGERPPWPHQLFLCSLLSVICYLLFVI